MRNLAALFLLLLPWPASVPAQTSVPLYTSVPQAPAWQRYNPAAEYVTVGQDEPGYRRWVAGATHRPIYVRAFHNYLVSNGVAGVAPTWQLLRTATAWRDCGAEPFEVPPTSEWANIVATLNYIGSYIVPAMGPVEPVSVYRNPALNACAGGAAASTHREMGAIDMVPLRPISRQALMQGLCAIHVTNSEVTNAGLGFYKGVRFHIDARKHREWGTQGIQGGTGCVAVLAESGISVRRVRPAIAVAAPPPVVAASAEDAPSAPAPTPAADPLAPGNEPVGLEPTVIAPPTPPLEGTPAVVPPDPLRAQ